jgi:type I restriction enzyme M protein
MPDTSSADQQFLDDLDKKLWNAADRLRSNLDAAVYKHAVLGLIFLKYISGTFDLCREEIKDFLRDQRSAVVHQKRGHKQERLSWEVRLSA